MSKKSIRRAGFVAADKLNWLPVNDELYREYVFPNGQIIRVDSPVAVSVKAPPAGSVGGGSHRIITKGLSVYIPSGWLAIRWQPRKGRAAYAW